MILFMQVSNYPEFVGGYASYFLPSAKYRRREAPVRHAVGVELGFQADGPAVVDFRSALPFALCQEVAGINLHPRQVSFYRHFNSRLLAGQHRRPLSGKTIVVVVTSGAAELFVLRANVVADALSGPEVERRARHVQQAARGQTARVALAEALSEYLQAVAQLPPPFRLK